MVKHTQTIRQQMTGKLFECADHFVGLVLKGLNIPYSFECPITFQKDQLEFPSFGLLHGSNFKYRKP